MALRKQNDNTNLFYEMRRASSETALTKVLFEYLYLILIMIVVFIKVEIN